MQNLSQNSEQLNTPNDFQIELSVSAKEHFVNLLKDEHIENMNLRMYVDNPGAPTADIGIAFCPINEEQADDLKVDFESFILFIDKPSAPFINNAKVDYKHDNYGGQLDIHAPNLHGKKPNEDATLAEKIEYLLLTEINPNLAAHGGMVSLVEITEENKVVLQFGGGCHGCGMANVTLKEGIEKTMLEKFPEITGVVDVTDHSTGQNPYY